MAAQQNRAAWLPSEKAYPYEVKSAPMWTPGDDEILVRNGAVAINPIDGNIQKNAFFPMQYPTILGHDVAGEVVQVGANVTEFKPGQRVLGQALGVMFPTDAGCGFQEYTTILKHMATELPDKLTYEQAAVVPLCFSTAAAGLFQDDYLKMDLPTEPARKPNGKTVLIWGGASSVGSNGIQQAVAAGYEVVTTASPKNFQYVKKLGASQVFDYNSPSVVDDIVAAFKGKKSAGVLDCVGSQAWEKSFQVASQFDGHKFVATTKRGFPDAPEGLQIKHIFAATVKDNKVGKTIFRDYLPRALKSGSFVASPEPLVVGKGVESIQSAVDFYDKGGVSAQKVVVSL